MVARVPRHRGWQSKSQKRRQGRRATIKAHSTPPLLTRPYGQCSLLPLFISSVDAYVAPARGAMLDCTLPFIRQQSPQVAREEAWPSFVKAANTGPHTKRRATAGGELSP